MNVVSKEANEVLIEIVENLNIEHYWEKRFESISGHKDAILRGCFKELKDNELIDTKWADNIPYIINVLKDGYMYYEHLKIGSTKKTKFEEEMQQLLYRAQNIKSPINVAPISISISEYNRPSVDWINDFEIFYNKYLKEHSLAPRIKTILFHRQLSAFNELVSCLTSISKDEEFIVSMRGGETVISRTRSIDDKYDVFISHANKDKLNFIDELYNSLDNLGINIFYDKKSLEWGDKWKDRILDGVKQSEFAIIVISENFFDREWTEKELNEFLNRQNQNGQKIILPVVHNITMEQLRYKYPSVAEIQAINSQDYTCDQIAILFAAQLIKRLKV
ncbi:MAG: toll/interleukin-1 receptor domain-containing protein [Lachnospiraceae bacterium]|nr:toll/interleukin-1 receptor domain-containing protein [Lachnospiraceae bacterium]